MTKSAKKVEEQEAGQVFTSAQLVLEFHKNRDGTDRDKPYELLPENGRVTIPRGSTDDDQGRFAYLAVSRVHGRGTFVILEQGEIGILDLQTETKIAFDGKCVAIFRGRSGQREITSITTLPSHLTSVDSRKVVVRQVHGPDDFSHDFYGEDHDPYVQGVEAFIDFEQNGVLRRNPYSDDAKEHGQWVEGYFSGLDDAFEYRVQKKAKADSASSKGADQ